jgi:hypothetical protein
VITETPKGALCSVGNYRKNQMNYELHAEAVGSSSKSDILSAVIFIIFSACYEAEDSKPKLGPLLSQLIPGTILFIKIYFNIIPSSMPVSHVISKFPVY